MRRLLLFLSVVAATPIVASAQSLVTARGVAFDSLRGVALRDAFITLDGARSTTSDERGTFQFDSVTLGAHTFAMQHLMLDSAGFAGIATQATVGSAPVVVATPSFATLWRRTCGANSATNAPDDSTGIVFGSVTDVRGERAVANAGVALTWARLGANQTKRVVQRRSRLDARSGSNGAYGICGVPLDVGVRLQAYTDDASSGGIDLAPSTLRVRRTDVRVGPNTTSARGTLVGIVTDTNGVAIANARVTMDERPEVRTGADGQFTIREVPIGTRQLEVLGLGLSPVTAIVDVIADEATFVNVRLRRVTQLETMRVLANTERRRAFEAFEARRTHGLGTIHDSTRIAGRGTMSAVLTEFQGAEIVRERGSSSSRFTVLLRGMRGRCVANVMVDGASLQDFDLSMLRPEEIAAIEVYPRSFDVPPELAPKDRECGLVAVWTKWRFR